MDPDRPGVASLKLPPVLGLTELIAVLGVSKTRVAGLIKQPGFPPPIAELSMGRVWDTQQIADYCATKGRTMHTRRGYRAAESRSRA